MGNWVERVPEPGETVRFDNGERKDIGVYLRRGAGSAQVFWIVDIGRIRLWLWDLTTFEVWEK